MRIVGGTLRGRRFRPAIGSGTRPTSERVREALASALQARELIAGRVVLDLYAGTGALAFEALSRGAERALLVERDRSMVKGLRRSIAELGLKERATVLPLDLARKGAAAKIAASALAPFDLVFADPPYARSADLPALFAALAAAGALGEEAALVVEHASSDALALETETDGLRVAPIAAYRYGDTAIQVMRAETGSASAQTGPS